MKSAVVAICLSLAAACAATEASAVERRVYSGSEAQALKCAAYFSFTANVMEQRGLTSTRNKEAANLAATVILAHHVSGTVDQKMKAYRTILKRMPQSDWALIKDTAKHIDWCEGRFLK